jgi:hypothetical protein
MELTLYLSFPIDSLRFAYQVTRSLFLEECYILPAISQLLLRPRGNFFELEFVWREHLALNLTRLKFAYEERNLHAKTRAYHDIAAVSASQH